VSPTREKTGHRLGVDVGGSGMKAAPVDLSTGTLLADRHRIKTPRPSTPDAVAEVLAQLVDHFSWAGPVGVAFPAVVKRGVTMTAANVDPAWVGCDAAGLFSTRVDRTVRVINDADAAGLAEMRYGAGKDRSGVVLMVTLGTGIGTALFVDGVLVPNTELGHLVIRGKDAEDRASDRVREDKALSWKVWAGRVEEYLQYVERLLQPDLLIVGGGVSKQHEEFLPRITTQTELVPAMLRNQAGIVGAARIAR
jgi:polyphosphate glucokinase